MKTLTLDELIEFLNAREGKDLIESVGALQEKFELTTKQTFDIVNFWKDWG